MNPPPKLAASDATASLPSRSSQFPRSAVEKLVGLRAVLFGERPTGEQLDRLGAIQQVLASPRESQRNIPPTLAIWLLMSKWSERFYYARGAQKIDLINRLYRQVSGDWNVNFKKDFPTLTKRLRRSFRNRNPEDPEWGLPAVEILTRRIAEYLAEREHQPELATTP